MADLGSDFSGILDIDPALTVVSGVRCLAEALARRLTTRAGSLLGDPSYGHDVRQYINAAIVNTSKIALAVENECLKDERVAGAVATVTFNPSTQTLTLDIVITISEDDTEFEFVLDVTETSADLLLRDAA